MEILEKRAGVLVLGTKEENMVFLFTEATGRFEAECSATDSYAIRLGNAIK